MHRQSGKLDIAIIGTGIAGLSAAWLLGQRHNVTVYEKAWRLGGHANTVMVQDGSGKIPVDMGFIVYNPETYPNLSALFTQLRVATQASDMSFGVSLRGGGLEYAGTDLKGLFAQKSNLLNPRFWSMMRDLVRFYRQGTLDARRSAAELGSLTDYLAAHRFGEALIEDHLLPMAAAIWSTPCRDMLDYPAASFLRFCDNHGLMRLTGRPQWHTVLGGSRSYVERISEPFADRIRLGTGVRSVTRRGSGVEVIDSRGGSALFDHVVIGAHADQALAMLTDPTDAERSVLGSLRYGANEAVMHRDPTLMPRRRKAWCSWNYLGDANDEDVCATYWMNRLQPLRTADPLFVTLNPHRPVSAETLIHQEFYEHPLFDLAALEAQRRLWSLQGVGGVWYCGAYFGAGFHEDGLQAGLAVAEALGGVRRPWSVPEESGRIWVGQTPAMVPA